MTQIDELLSGREQTVTVNQSDIVSHAANLMIQHDFSQLPVIDENNSPIGLITEMSIIRSIMFLEPNETLLGPVNLVMERHIKKVEQGTKLEDVLDDLKTIQAVLVVSENSLIGIVTNWDVVEYYRSKAESWLLIGDIENAVKKHVSYFYTHDETKLKEALQEQIARQEASRAKAMLQKALKQMGLSGKNNENINNIIKNINNIIEGIKEEKDYKIETEATFSTYKDVLIKKWGKDSFSIKEKSIKIMLENVNMIRNKLAHFRDGDLTIVDKRKLKFYKDWFDGNLNKISLDSLGSKTNIDSISKSIEEQPKQTIPDEEKFPSYYSKMTNLLFQIQDQNELTLGFIDIENTLEAQLPQPARQHPSWWQDIGDYIVSNAGWKIVAVNIQKQQVTFVKESELTKQYTEFFQMLLKALSDEKLAVNKNPRGTSWHVLGKFVDDNNNTVATLSFAFTRDKRPMVNLYIDGQDKINNKKVYNQIAKYKEAIKEAYRENEPKIVWEELPTRSASKIAIYDSQNRTINDPEILDWAIPTISVFKKEIEQIMKETGYEYRIS